MRHLELGFAVAGLALFTACNGFPYGSDRALNPYFVDEVQVTHLVTPDGSTASDCAPADPCALSRAVRLVEEGAIPPGSVIGVAAGVYTQPALQLRGSGTADAPIRFLGETGARLTSARLRPEASRWTLVPGRQYTYVLSLEASEGNPGLPVQSPPVTNWRPIWVEDRAASPTVPSTRRFDLYFPPPYALRSSIDQVEAQMGTGYVDAINRRVYVHLFHDDAPPSEASNLHVQASGWGSVEVIGDHLQLENLQLEHTALVVRESADGTVLRRITALATQVTLRGVRTLAEDLDVSHLLVQRTDPQECGAYDVNPGFGVGECFHANAIGSPLIVGIDEDNKTFEQTNVSFGQVVRRAKVHRSWNGILFNGPNVLEDSVVWGVPNHILGGYKGSGGVIRNNAFLNGQDSLFFGDNGFDDLTVEHNFFAFAVLVAYRDAGTRYAPFVPELPTRWRFRHNVLTSLVMDQPTFTTVTSDCNVWFQNTSSPWNLMRVAYTEPTFTYRSLAEVQTNTTLEVGSIQLPHARRTDGSLFLDYRGAHYETFDLHPASAAAEAELTICGERAGPQLWSR